MSLKRTGIQLPEDLHLEATIAAKRRGIPFQQAVWEGLRLWMGDDKEAPAVASAQDGKNRQLVEDFLDLLENGEPVIVNAVKSFIRNHKDTKKARQARGSVHKKTG